MDYDEFVSRVRSALTLDSREQAEAAAHTTLTILGQRLNEDEAKDLAAQLPDGLAEHVRGTNRDELDKFSLDDFFGRVGDQVGEGADGERYARAVIGVLSDSVSGGELEDVFAQLPDEFADLLAPKDV